jgi:hypothetical protein
LGGDKVLSCLRGVSRLRNSRRGGACGFVRVKHLPARSPGTLVALHQWLHFVGHFVWSTWSWVVSGSQSQVSASLSMAGPVARSGIHLVLWRERLLPRQRWSILTGAFMRNPRDECLMKPRLGCTCSCCAGPHPGPWNAAGSPRLRPSGKEKALELEKKSGKYIYS